MYKKGLTPLETIGKQEKYKMSLTGLTLIEIIVSLVLMALILMGLVSIFVAGKGYIQYSHTKMTGGELGKVFLDPLQMDVRQDLWGSNCLSNPPINCPVPQSIDNVTYNPDYAIEDVIGTNLRRVKLTISWPKVQP